MKNPPLRCWRYGFTLFELVLVLFIIIAILAIGLPSLQQMLRRSQLEHTAKTVRRELYSARLLAMKTGTPHVFQYMERTGNFCVSTQTTEEQSQHSNTGGGGKWWQTLPHRVLFAGGRLHTEQAATPERTEWDDGGVGATSFGNGVMTRSEDTRLQLSKPIVFYPNGRTSSASLWLMSSDGDYTVELTLRGLTGTVYIGHVRKQP